MYFQTCEVSLVTTKSIAGLYKSLVRSQSLYNWSENFSLFLRAWRLSGSHYRVSTEVWMQLGELIVGDHELNNKQYAYG